MKSHFLIILLAVSFLSACATRYKADVDYNPSYDFNAVSTYAILVPATVDAQGNTSLSPHVSSLDHDRIVNAIHRNLQAKGMSEAQPDVADTLIRFQIATKDKSKVRTYNTGVYTCWRCYGAYTYPHMMQQVEVKDYTEGTVVIDMVDPNTNKSVWRSILSHAISKNVPVEEKQARIQQIVDAMLQEYKTLP
ncbi:DUF4136 domain-containing protein [Thalassotalea ponticola]|uniref:DUF4136 domain-containing protein n=1 Tax=Thalassotalea ponticola TaxID=1523392 RepID=UPI0025B3CB9C|nr:DUF4136 domain-containing protein [Thalassotalea ponticola]MDN3651544.1 DUF4136 domain-containing protein [Thalassotalea ponticola]